MRDLRRRTLVLSLVVLFAGCARELPYPIPPEHPLEGEPDHVVGVGEGRDSVTEVRWGQLIEWRSDDPGAVWVVVFADSTPFLGRRPTRVFNGAGPGFSNRGRLPRAPSKAPEVAEYKFWIFNPDGAGGYEVIDPKLVIRR